MSLRMEKVNSQIRRCVMEIIQAEVDDPHLGLVSITRVDTTADLRESKVFFSVIGGELEDTQRILNSMCSFIRHNLARKIRLKIIPKLIFLPDSSIKYSVDIFEKIERIKKEENRKKS